jgi:hypothetical protein
VSGGKRRRMGERDVRRCRLTSRGGSREERPVYVAQIGTLLLEGLGKERGKSNE